MKRVAGCWLDFSGDSQANSVPPAVDWYMERNGHAAADFLEEFELALDLIAAGGSQ